MTVSFRAARFAVLTGVLAVAALWLAVDAKAATLTVPTSPGCATIQDCVNAAAPGDTIKVKPKNGNGAPDDAYYESVVVDKQLAIVGQKCGNKQPVVDPDGIGNEVGFNVDADDVRLECLTIRHGEHGVDVLAGSDGFRGMRLRTFGQDEHGIRSVGDGLRVMNSELFNLDGRGVSVEDGSDIVLSDNHVHHVGSDCFELFGGTSDVRVLDNRLDFCDDQGVRSHASDLLVRGNIINNANNGIEHDDGADPVILRNQIFNPTDRGIKANSADNAVVRDNFIRNTRNGWCIEVEGDRPNVLVERNVGDRCGGGGIRVDGDVNPVIRNNKLTNIAERQGMEVRCTTTCDGALIQNNQILRLDRDHHGMEVRADAPGFQILGNRIEDTGGHGIRLCDFSEGFVMNNRVTRAGIREGDNDRVGIRLDCGTSNSNLIQNNVVTGGKDDAFGVEGDSNTFIGNVAEKNAKDGFHVYSGDGNVFNGNTARRNGAEGFENDGDNTDWLNNVAQLNRQPCANDGTIDDHAGNSWGALGNCGAGQVD